MITTLYTLNSVKILLVKMDEICVNRRPIKISSPYNEVDREITSKCSENMEKQKEPSFNHRYVVL